MLIVGFKCDICGQFVTRPWASGRPEIPEGWARIRAEQPVEKKGAYIHDGTICPECFKALFKGELPHVPFDPAEVGRVRIVGEVDQ